MCHHNQQRQHLPLQHSRASWHQHISKVLTAAAERAEQPQQPQQQSRAAHSTAERESTHSSSRAEKEGKYEVGKYLLTEL